MKEKVLAHRKQFLIGECICLIFFGCFTFPVYNFSKDAPNIVLHLFIVVVVTSLGRSHSMRAL